MKYLALLLLGVTHPLSVNAQTCTQTDEIHAFRVQGVSPQGDYTDQLLPEIAGDHSFYQRLPNGWVFSLVKAEMGWDIRVYDSEPVGDAVDLTALTPPLRAPINPRDIYGWHFRNAHNTGPNTGDVNAPQELRAFIVSPSLAGTGGFRPPDGATTGIPVANPTDGIAWLRVVDFGLAGLEPGSTARMNYLQFDACVTWPRSAEETQSLRDHASDVYLPEEVAAFGNCGLDIETTHLQATVLPRLLDGDIDGDGAIDEIVQVVLRGDNNRGLALCRAGIWLTKIDLSPNRQAAVLRDGFVDQMEAWHWVSRETSSETSIPSRFTDITLPESDGDILILERIEKEAIAVYWQDGIMREQELYRYVEP